LLSAPDMDSPVYLIAEQRITADAPGFAEAIAAAYQRRTRPRCLCQAEGIEMYVARLGDGYIVKRMPHTGGEHAPDCPSFEPPPDLSGLGQVLGTAIKEDTATGETTLKLGFSMSRMPGRSAMPAQPGDSDSAHTDGTKLSLRGLLHYLWDQAGLTRWHPAFAGRRSWGTVRRHLLLAAQHKVVRGIPLEPRLYIPEVFSVEQRDAINARRLAQWRHATDVPGKPQHLMLLIGEVKEIVPARYGYRAVVKHVPDQAFTLDEQLFRRLGRRFESELALWNAMDSVHMVMIATFGVGASGVPTLTEVSLMPATNEWLLFENPHELQLIGQLVREQRTFIKNLRYCLARDQAVAAATLTDVGDSPVAVFIDHGSNSAGADGFRSTSSPDGTAAIGWTWHTPDQASLSLPLPVSRHAFAASAKDHPRRAVSLLGKPQH
jgi:hypothetical protein